MNIEQSSLDATIRDAVEQHGAALDATVPDFSALLAVRHRRTRRTLAAATAVMALLGVGGIIAANSRTAPPSDAVSGDAPAADITTADTGPAPSATTTILALPAGTSEAAPLEFFCTDSLGEDQLGRQLFSSCEPQPADLDGDFACTGRIRSDNGFVVFSSCTPVGQLGPIPGDDPDRGSDDGRVPVRPTPHVVRSGDHGFKIADEFCVSIADLEAANGWADHGRDFPIPGSEILIPSDFDESRCEIGAYTITADDTTRIGVADKFCISVQSLDAANIETEGYDSFFPGLVIVIPASSDDTC